MERIDVDAIFFKVKHNGTNGKQGMTKATMMGHRNPNHLATIETQREKIG